MAKYFMGIDGGTGSLRVAIFDEKGKNMGYEVVEYDTYFPKSGWAEQDDSEWWEAMKAAIPKAIKNSAVEAKDIAAVTCDGTTSTVVLFDKDDNILRKPILWMDVRAADQAQRISDAGHRMNHYYKSGVPAESLIPKCLWIKENEPEIWGKTKTVFEYTSWMNWKLSGKKTVDNSIAAFRWFYDDLAGGWQKDFYETIGLGDLLEKIPENILKTGEVLGKVSAEAASVLGLCEDTLVIEGAFDACACMLGVGSVAPGGMAMIGGSSTCLFGLSEKEFHAEGVNGAYPNCAIDDTSLVEGGQSSSGSVLNWFKKNLAPKSWFDEAEAGGFTLYNIADKYAASVPIGCNGLIMLDYFQGNRAPYSDSLARGMFVGLSLSHETKHIARAILEGVAFGAAHCLKAMDECGYKVEKIYACGGMAESDLWLQIHADVTGIPIYITRESQSAGCLGDAMAGAVGYGLYASLEEAAENMVEVVKFYTPDAANHQEYKFFLDKYIALWPSVSDLVHDVVNHVNK
ncbi:FGGY-family carbohydrate kinase [Acetobacterium bakii]|uniref:Sugar kinase n=1 Tax=Acetobacterium bakii TaxID=52689 RepID=A0A0L6U0B1_9FIRM|nr:FGGY family carbohydrate kinase [Acetobacterium bakii]KNZ41928.1 sugar kinase [Acetobacterium bakii]